MPPPSVSYWHIHQEETHTRLREGVSHRARIERDRHVQMIRDREAGRRYEDEMRVPPVSYEMQ